LAADAQLALHTHLHQSRFEIDVVVARTGRRPVELMAELGVLGPATVAAHCIHMTAADMALFRSTGAHVAHVPVGNAASGSMAPALELMRCGANISLATDTKSGDMFEAMKFGLVLTRLRGHGFALRSVDVLRWATLGGAQALGLRGEIGAIAPGYRADLVLLDGAAPNLVPLIDGPGTIVHGAQGANVDTVMVDGRIVLEHGRPTLFDGEEVLRSAQAVALGLWRRIGHAPKAFVL
jgi:5-methylthioadenosine/S-adenosylhomocysteine deaminase